MSRSNIGMSNFLEFLTLSKFAEEEILSLKLSLGGEHGTCGLNIFRLHATCGLNIFRLHANGGGGEGDV